MQPTVTAQECTPVGSSTICISTTTPVNVDFERAFSFTDMAALVFIAVVFFAIPYWLFTKYAG